MMIGIQIKMNLNSTFQNYYKPEFLKKMEALYNVRRKSVV